MAEVVVTLRIMPQSPDTDLEKIRVSAEEKIKVFGGNVGKVEEQSVAFGLKALNIIFIMEEAKGSTEPLEIDIASIDGVQSAEAVDVRRAIG